MAVILKGEWIDWTGAMVGSVELGLRPFTCLCSVDSGATREEFATTARKKKFIPSEEGTSRSAHFLTHPNNLLLHPFNSYY